MTIKEEGEGLRTQSTIWELDATDPESNDKWNIGRVLVSANNLVVVAEKGEKEGGFAAIDDLFFKIDPEFLDNCGTIPPSVSIQNPMRQKLFSWQANPGGTTLPPPNTTPSPSPLPGCNFDTGTPTCGWEVTRTRISYFQNPKFPIPIKSDPLSGRVYLVG